MYLLHTDQALCVLTNSLPRPQLISSSLYSSASYSSEIMKCKVLISPEASDVQGINIVGK